MSHPLREYRTKHGISQADLANQAGLSQGALGHIEVGRRKPSPSVAIKLEQITGGEVTRHDLRPDIYAPPPVPPDPRGPERRSGADRRQSANRRAEESPGRRQGDDRRAAERRQGENCREETDAA